MTANAPVVHIVDDDASCRTSVSRLLGCSGYATAAFPSAAALLAHVTRDTRGCVVTDLCMPEVNGLELQDALRESAVALPVVFLTGRGDIPTTVHAMRDGAEDFLEKRAPKALLLDAVRRALARDAAAHERRARRHALQRSFDALTPREREVLECVVRGQMNKTIAAALGIHERTVKLHRTSITSKMGVRSAAELARLAHEAGLFDAGT